MSDKPIVPPIRQPREVARSIGKGVRTIGKGLYETGAGFVEGLGVPKITPRSVGKGAGRLVRSAGEASQGMGFRDPDWFWGGIGEPRESTRKPTSRLPFETQKVIIDSLAELYPEVYMAIWSQGIQFPEFIGSLRNNFPEIYEELREQASYPHHREPYREPYEESTQDKQNFYPPRRPPMI